MRNLKSPQRWLFVAVAGLCAATLCAATPEQIPADKKSPTVNYVGDAACATCHQEKVNTYHHTAHFLTSQLPTRDSIKGNFTPGSNSLTTLNSNLVFSMSAVDGGFAQTATIKISATDAMERSERFDVVVGSGRKGQTYLFWRNDLLFQLPVSYWTELGNWMNSPGYPDGKAVFERPVTPRCLECHASSFKALPAPPPNHYVKNSLVLGITCERCHGPGEEHSARFRLPTPPKAPADMAIVNPAGLSRDRQLDVCGLCHAGGDPQPGVPALSFVAGDVLEKFLDLPKPGPQTKVDVHGGQVHLLRKSRCFQSSPAMSCSTCHNVHAPQRDVEAFAANCLGCHKIESCGEFPKLAHKIDNQCVVCHMPLQQTEQIISSENGVKLRPRVRNHQIAIYPDVRLP